MKRLAIISTHPIQYNGPLFRLLSAESNIEIKVFYTWGQAQNKVYDPGFGKEREWDIPLLTGYEYEFLENVSNNPGSHHFNGIDNPAIIEKILFFNPDAILIFGWSFKSHLKAIRYFSGKKRLIFRGDSTMLDEAAMSIAKKIIRRLFLKWVYSHIDIALYAGEENKKYYLEHGLKKDQLVFAPHAIENERFFDKDGKYQQQAMNWRRELGIKDDELVFLFAGKLEPKKDPELLLSVFMKCPADNIRLIIAGNGILEESLKNKAYNDSRVVFLPFQNQSIMPVLYRLCDIFVLPSKGPGETWGLAVNEAMASRKGIIVSDKCGCAIDLVRNKQSGFVFSSGSESELANAIASISESRTLSELFGRNAERIIEKWNYYAQVSAIESLLAGSIKTS